MKRIYLFVLLCYSTVIINAQSFKEQFSYNKRSNFNVSHVFKQDLKHSTFNKIVIDGFENKVPFYQYLQKEKSNKFIILLHGLGDSKEGWINPSEPYLKFTSNLTKMKDSLLNLGYNIVIPDAKFHGERSHELNFRPPETLPFTLATNENDVKKFAELMTDTIKDIRIIMDYLESTQGNIKFNIIGYSMGGAMALLLNASETRINSVAACVPPLNHPKKDINNANWSKSITTSIINSTPYLQAKNQLAPTALFLGETDFFYTKDEVKHFMKNIPHNKKVSTYYNSGHELPSKYIYDVIVWVEKSNQKIK